MQVILTEDIPKLGMAGEVVKVRSGFGRNFLLPQGKAMLATPDRVERMEHQRRVVEEKQRKDISGQEGLARELAGVDLTFEMQASPEGKLFGSVTNADIAARLAEGGFQIDRRKIELAEPIKLAGEHTASLRLHREVIVELQVKVVSAGIPEPELDLQESEEETEDSDEFSDEEASSDE
jgi:large subunit ribosomal protein L9